MERSKKPRSTLQKRAEGTGSTLFALGLLVAGLGVATNRIEFGKEHGTGYTNSDANVKVWHLFGKVIYISNQPFKESDKVNPEGFPLKTAVATDEYKPNKALSSDEATKIAQKLTELGFLCPGDADTVPYNPVLKPTSEQTSTTIPQLDLRICFDFGKTSVKGGNVMVPLGLEPRDGIPAVELRYPSKTIKCAATMNKYAFEANGYASNAAQELGLQVTGNDHLNLLVTANSDKPDPCDMGQAAVVPYR